ncbi:hypothetical protein SAMN05216334_10941 [Nitrosomonas ureae]|uniref:Uncharacterized protein n=2 Tax=Nitrosomonas ureae TaxID=44577 RepID=A0A1H5UVD5_9PROT|nr:hypothetical protein SAMN05216334_10941 [Nitrosomonas ureae]
MYFKITILSGFGIQDKGLKNSSWLLKRIFIGCIVMMSLLGQCSWARADVELVHTYGNSLGQEVVNIIAVSASRLLPLLPAGYNLIPAASVGFGGPDQGIVVIANFRGIDPTVDQRKPLNQNQVAVDVAILVSQPEEAAQAEVDIPGAFHVYTLAIYTNDARYAASLYRADIPVEFVNKIDYQRNMNDVTGVGDLIVNIPSKDSPFHTLSSGLGYAPVPGAFNAVFWHDGEKGKAVLHFLDQPFQQGTAISHIYTQPASRWDNLFEGGGLGTCDPHPETEYRCVIVPALNLRYDEGTVGKLQLIR